MIIKIDPICQMPDQKNSGAQIQKACCDMYIYLFTVYHSSPFPELEDQYFTVVDLKLKLVITWIFFITRVTCSLEKH